MGVFPAPWTAVRTTPNRSPRQNVPRKGVVLHHAAMTSLSGLRSLSMGGKEVSATAIVKDAEAELLVPDADRPWSLASAWGDSSFRSVETCNESTDGWTISDASHWTLARLVAHWAGTDGFWPHRDGDPRTWTVIGHREANTIWGISYATACPGGMDLGLVTRRAQQLLRTATTAGGVPQPIEEDDEMDDGYYIKNGKTGSIFRVSRVKGTKRHITANEYAVLKDVAKAEGVPLIVTVISNDAVVKAIPNATS